ncbi:hypothetical protein [Paracoccus yeei]
MLHNWKVVLRVSDATQQVMPPRSIRSARLAMIAESALGVRLVPTI